MNWLRRQMFGKVKALPADRREKSDMLWNMAGSLIYAAVSMLLTAVVNHLVGLEEGGIFGFAFSTFGQQMFLVAYFGIRPVQSTDVGGNYTFDEYRRLRLATCAAAVLMGAGYLAVCRYDKTKTIVVFLMVLYKALDGFADVYESEFQRDGSLYLTGKAMAFRTLFSAACFIGALAVTRNLVFSCVVAVVSQAAGVALFDCNTMAGMGLLRQTAAVKRCIMLLKDSFLLFLSVFLDGFIFSMARYAVDARMTSTDLALFNAIFLPTSVIYLVANFVIRPYLTKMSLQWEEKRLDGFAGSLRTLLTVIGGLTVLALAGAWILGVPVLGLISNADLKPYKSGLMYIILGGGFYAVMNLFYYALVIMKCRKGIFFGYVPVTAISFVLSWALVGRGGVNGGAFAYLLVMVLLSVCFIAEVGWLYGKEKRHGRKHP